MWLVHDPCDCEENGQCYGKANIALFESEQTARQEADKRSKRYGGYSGSPHMHLDWVPISHKTSDY